jgi:cytoskeletal protein RodZ
LRGSFHGIAVYLVLPSGKVLLHYFGRGEEEKKKKGEREKEKKKESEKERERRKVKRNEPNWLFTVMLWSAVRAVGVLFVLILEFCERKETVWWCPDCKVTL